MNQLFPDVARTNKAYCASLGLPDDTYDRTLTTAEVYGTPLSADEMKVAAMIQNSTSRQAAESVVAVSNMPAPAVRVRPSSPARCVVEYARPVTPVNLWEKQDITPFYEECRAKHEQRAGVWVGD